ncbi:MAG: D-alanyl-D-alanine carboxypeptidase [Firmicutes bacterium]|nr:D-alanyl-D-alanine carboxypeptidase [Bacillota bacterium]
MFFLVAVTIWPADLCEVHAQQLAPPTVSARAVCLLDAESGRVLYSKAAHERLPIASLTKIVTATVALEKDHVDREVSIPDAAVGVEGSSIYLQAHEHMTLRQLLYGMMLRSGNDAATAVALLTSGSVEGFVREMNDLATRLQLQDSHFTNPAGLDTGAPYSSAYDLAKIAAYASRLSDFREIVSTKAITIPWEGKSWQRRLINENKMLRLYPGADGIKTGYTRKAGRCLATSASRDGFRIICVVLNDPNDWEDTRHLLDYGYATFTRTPLVQQGIPFSLKVANGKVNQVQAIASETLYYPLKEGERERVRWQIAPDILQAPVSKGTSCADLFAKLDGQSLGHVSMICAQDVPKRPWWQRLRNSLASWSQAADQLSFQRSPAIRGWG